MVIKLPCADMAEPQHQSPNVHRDKLRSVRGRLVDSPRIIGAAMAELADLPAGRQAHRTQK